MAPPEWKQYSPDPHRRADGDAAEDSAPLPAITPYEAPAELPYVRTVEERTVRRGPQGAGSKALVLALMAIVVAVGFAVSRSDREQHAVAPEPGIAAQPEPAGPSPMSAEGFARLLDALQEQQGSTLVFEAVLREDAASLTVPFRSPVAPGDGRAVELVWDGTELTRTGDTSERAAPYELTGLVDVDLAGLCAEARSLLDGSTGCYLMIATPDASTQRTPITAWASAPFDAGAVVWFDRHGRKVDQTVS